MGYYCQKTFFNRSRLKMLNYRTFSDQYKLLKYGLLVQMGEIISLYFLPMPLHPPQPVHSLLLMERY